VEIQAAAQERMVESW